MISKIKVHHRRREERNLIRDFRTDFASLERIGLGKKYNTSVNEKMTFLIPRKARKTDKKDKLWISTTSSLSEKFLLKPPWTNRGAFISFLIGAVLYIVESTIVEIDQPNPILGARGGGGTPWNFCWGCAARISKARPNFRPKKCHFPHPFSDLASKIHTRFQTWPCTRLSIAYASALNGSLCNKDE